MQLYSVLSSAKLQTSDFAIEKNKPLINVLKSRGPRYQHLHTQIIYIIQHTNKVIKYKVNYANNRIHEKAVRSDLLHK